MPDWVSGMKLSTVVSVFLYDSNDLSGVHSRSSSVEAKAVSLYFLTQ